MKILTKNKDLRINSTNILIEMSVQEYYDLSREILSNNDFQRNRVKSSSSVYSLLKDDIKKGCIIPPLVLALRDDITKDQTDNEIESMILSQKNKLIILDGLQRTYTIKDLVEELEKENIQEDDQILQYPIRIEVYTGLNKIGILYRMLTLNTGQTPMSTRHQIEIIYSDYIGQTEDGITLLREVDDETKKGAYKFRDIIEGFTSYLERDYLTMDRMDILENVKSLERLATENQNTDLFKDYLLTYHSFLTKIEELSADWLFDDSALRSPLSTAPFGKNSLSIFNKSQVMTGFGAAIGKLVQQGIIKSLQDVKDNIIPQLTSDDLANGLNILIQKLDEIRIKAKKIGNAQRYFFSLLFKHLFSSHSDGYLNLEKAIQEADNDYRRETY